MDQLEASMTKEATQVRKDLGGLAGVTYGRLPHPR